MKTPLPFPTCLDAPIRRVPDVPGLRERRLILIVPSLVLAAVVLLLSVAVLAGGPHTVLDWVIGVPFALTMAWECFVVWQLALGFAAWLRGRTTHSKLERRAAQVEPDWTGRSRTAVLVPIYEEDPAEVFAKLRIMVRSLARAGSDDIDVHVLSDTRSDGLAEAERREWASLEPGGEPRVFYRRRRANRGRKAGNLADFFEQHGGDYDFAIVLDADSLMSGTAMRRLICLMEEHPQVGLIQTVSYATGRDTLFARIQQFAVRVYAPLALRGLEYWQGPEGSYWGHNAILRVAPFRAHCGLPVLPGRPPLGGEILCHDVVEAALLARAGWAVHLLPEFDGTWEEMPTNTIDLLGRERRWCQGNLQHLKVLGLPGLRSGSRGHIALGIGGYLTAPLWWSVLLLGAARVLLGPGEGGLGVLAYGLTEPGLPAAALATAGVGLLLMPRLLNLVRVLADRDLRRGFGGASRLLAGVAVEQGFWLLLGPVLSLVNAGFVVRTFAGGIVPWEPQCRADRSVTVFEALRHHWPHVSLAIVLGATCAAAGGWYAVWMAPAVLGLLLSPALTAVSSRTSLGRLSRRLGLFQTVDDTAPAAELLELRAAARRAEIPEPVP